MRGEEKGREGKEEGRKEGRGRGERGGCGSFLAINVFCGQQKLHLTILY